MQSPPTTSPSLSALAKAGSERAQTYLGYHRLAHLIALVLALFMLIIKQHEWLVYVLAVIALLAELLAWGFRYKEEHDHHLARQLMRRAILQNAFDKVGNTMEIVHLRQHFETPHLIQQATQLDQFYQDGGYFTSQFPQGTTRFLDNLQESAFWSSYLYRMVAQRTFWMIGVVLLTMLVVVFAIIPVVAGGSISLIPKLFSILFIFWLADELTTGLAWWEAADSAIQVDRRAGELLKLQQVSQAELLAVFSDYAVATTTAPPLAMRHYAEYRERLNELWKQRKAGREISQTHS